MLKVVCHRLAATAVVCALCLPAGSAWASSFYSVADIFSQADNPVGVAYDYAWRPDGQVLTYLLRQKDERLANFYALNVSTGQRQVLVAGQVLGSAVAPLVTIHNPQSRERMRRYSLPHYRWSPQGNAIIFIRDNQVWQYRLASGKARQLTHTPGAKRNPQLSPNEKWVSYIANANLYYVSVNGGKVRSVAPTPEDVRSGYAWSPDSHYNCVYAI